MEDARTGELVEMVRRGLLDGSGNLVPSTMTEREHGALIALEELATRAKLGGLLDDASPDDLAWVAALLTLKRKRG